MPTEVILPKVDMDMASGRISRWFCKEGDTIRKGEPLFEIETDKAAMEVDAPASGTLRNVTGVEGVDIAVGSPVAWIVAEGEAAGAAGAGTDDAPKPRIVGPDPDVEVDTRPAADGQAEALAGGVGESAATREPGSAAGGKRSGVRATPLARRIARERGIELSTITGRGPLGRIGRDDVELAAHGAPDAAAGRRSPPGDDARSPDRPIGPAFARPSTAPARTPSAAASHARPPHLVRLREGNGTPIVLVHGFGSESASWRPLLGELADGGGPIVGVDLAGHGESLASEARDFDALVAGVEDGLAAAGLTSCHLVGHSLGGAAATAVAAGTAVDVRSLMLIAPAGFGPDIDTGFVNGFARATEEASIRVWLRHLVEDPAALSDGFVRATARSRADGRQAEAQTRLAAGLFSNGTQHFEVRGLLPHLAMPVKIVAGADDRVVPVRHFSGLPGAVALHVFPRTGHLPQMERRADVARLLRQLVR